MLVRRFLDRLAQADPSRRAQIVRALVRVYLEVPLDPSNRAATATALLAVLDDPAPRVRRSMAEALAESPLAPRAVIRGLADDQPDIAGIVLARSPVLTEAELVDFVGAGCERTRRAVASRPDVGIGLAAAIVEVSGPDACTVLLANPGAAIAVSSMRRLVERHRGDPDVRGALLARDDLPVTLRQSLIDGLSEALGEMVVLRDWLSPERTQRLLADARERAVMDLALGCDERRLAALVEMLVAERRVTPATLVRALCVGNLRFVEEALSIMARTPLRRVAGLLQDRKGAGLAALYRRTGLPMAALPALLAILEVMREQSPDGTAAGRARMGRVMLERVLTRIQGQGFSSGELDEFLALLERLASEAAREEARAATGGYFRAA